MNPLKTIAFAFALCLVSVAMDAAPQPLRSIGYLGYNPQTNLDDLPQTILYQFPDPNRFGPGPYPVFVWTPATYESNVDILSVTFVAAMAARGFVGASVQYSNSNVIQSCSDYVERARSVFDVTRAESAASVICSVAGAGCDNGMVTAGISQGGMLAVLARNYAPNVQAAFAMSVSDYNRTGIDVSLASCMDKQYTAIPANRLMIVNGQNDPYIGGQTSVENVSGFTCPGSFQCWSPDGSGAGWYLVQDAYVTDGKAEHCYQLVGDCSPGLFDANWYFPAKSNWSLKPNLDWLSTFGTQRVFSDSGQ